MSRPFRFNGHGEDDSISNALHLQSTHTRFTSLAAPQSVCPNSHSLETANLGMNAAQLDFKVPPQYLPAHSDPHEQIFYRGRNSYSSVLDGDDDTTSASGCSFSSGNEPEPDTGDNDSTQISLHGPTIRFHSRAPWETDDIPEGDESDYNGRSSNAWSNLSRRKNTSKADTLIRTFTRRSSIASRPSAESSSLTTNAKAPFEFFAARSSRHSLSQEPPGSNLPRSPPTSPSVTFQNSWQTPTGGCLPSNDHPTTSPGENSPSTAGPHSSNDTPVSPSFSSPRSPSATQSILRTSQDSTASVDFVHPYANPDLVISHTSIPHGSPQQTGFTNINRSDSFSTVTESISSKPTVFPVMSREAAQNVFTPKDVQSDHRIRKREISSPTPLLHGSSAFLDRNTKFLSLHPPPLGGAPQPHLPAVALISLQEAQARERSRSATHVAAVPSNNVNSVSRVCSPVQDDAVSIRESRNDPDTSTRPLRSRTMSISVGSRAKTTLHSLVGGVLPQPERRSSEASVSSSIPPRRVLKHKKSGFMRLFSARVEGEKSPPPPVPLLSDTHQNQDLRTTSSMTSSKVSLTAHSVIRTSLAGVEELATSLTDMDASSEEVQDSTFDPKSTAAPRKRPPPPLYIATGSSSSLPSSESKIQSRTPAVDPRSALLSPSNVPQSAPPIGSDFKGLKLRPVSAVFSAHFADFVTTADTDEHLDSCATSPTVNSGAIPSPLTPYSNRPSDEEPRPVLKVLGEQSLAVKALQDQFVAAKKAWQHQIWELKAQVRDLQTELEDLQAIDDKEYCEFCHRGNPQKQLKTDESKKKFGVVNRPRARISDAARFSNGNRD